MKKRLLSVIMAAVMMLTTAPYSALAAENEAVVTERYSLKTPKQPLMKFLVKIQKTVLKTIPMAVLLKMKMCYMTKIWTVHF